jgi:hypothetical protein
VRPQNVAHSGIAKNVLENVPGIVRVIPLVTSVIDVGVLDAGEHELLA